LTKLRASGQIEFITFHQSYAYEDFVVSMRPDPDSDTLKFLQHKGIFYEMCRIAKRNFEAATKGTGKKRSFEEVFQEFLQPLEEGQVEKIPVKMKAGKTFYITEVSDKSIAFEMPSGSSSYTMSISTLKDLVEGVRELGSGLVSYYSPLVELIRSKQETKEKAEPRKNYVLIIDEINRGNISRIFGELITLLEDDKRLGEKNELRVTLPNGEKGFGVPPNLYLIGTMNTADKSIALLDIALRRRFEFIGKYPVYDDLTPMVQEKLEKLNEAITEAKKSPDFMIGHAYFIDKPDDDFPKIMNRKIIPLLYEYFNGRAEFVKRILDSAEISVKKNPISHSWEAKAQ
jgi:5-methylcytosine-specific restriction protein B